MPVISANSSFLECANGFGYLSSPLGLLLPKEERDAYEGRLSRLAETLAGSEEGAIRLGQNYKDERKSL